MEVSSEDDRMNISLRVIIETDLVVRGYVPLDMSLQYFTSLKCFVKCSMRACVRYQRHVSLHGQLPN